MLRPRTRTTIIALIASLSIAGTSVAPTVSQAAKNNGAYSRSAEALKKKQQEQYCGGIALSFEIAHHRYKASVAEGNTSEAERLWGLMHEIAEQKLDVGCGPIQRTSETSPTHGLVAPVGGIKPTA